MKTLPFIIIAVMAISCQKEQPIEQVPEEVPFYVGTVKCGFNSEIWNGVAAGIYANIGNNSRHNLTITKTTSGYSGYFGDFKLELGKQLLAPHDQGQGELLSYLEFHHSFGDVSDGFYSTLIELDSFENYLEITSIDLDKQEVQGKFQAALAIDSLYKDFNLPTDPDTIVLTNGTFKTLIAK